MHLYARYTLFVLLCCTLVCTTGVAQEPALTTRQQQLKEAIATADHVLNTDSAIVIYDTLLQQSIRANYADGAFLCLIRKSIKYYEKEDFNMDRYCSIQALPWAEKSSAKDNVAWCYGNVAEAYIYEGDYSKALEYLYIATEELNKRTKEPNHTAANLYNLFALVYMKLNQPEKAMGYYDLAEEVSGRAKLYYQQAMTFTDKATYYLSIHQDDSAEKCYQKIRQIGEQINKPDLEAIADVGTGKTLIDRGDYNKAIAYLQEAIVHCTGHYDYIVTDARFALVDVYIKQHDYSKAETTAKLIIDNNLSRRLDGNYIKAYTLLGNIYRATGNTKLALTCMDTLMVLKDAKSSREKLKAVSAIEGKYKAAENEKLLAQNQLLIARQKSKIFQKNVLLVSIGAGVFALAILLLAQYRNYRNRQRLHEEEVKTLQKEKTIGTLKGMVDGADNERSRIARELHDGIGGMLSAAMMRIRSIRHEDTAIAKTPGYIEGMEMLDRIGDEIRKTAHNLMPGVLLKQTLPEALETYCNMVQSGGDTTVEFHSFGSFNDLGQDVKLNVYRIVQELLKNIVQHAAATHALVQLTRRENVLTITVEDNGKGFDPVMDTKGGGIGLANLTTRVESMNGAVEIDSTPENGTSVYIEFEVSAAGAINDTNTTT